MTDVPAQIVLALADTLTLGVTVGVTVILNVAVVAHCPASGVNV